MVNPGHASKGCMNCRTRRIKCDETQPNCRKCVASGRTCLGYRDQTRRVVQGTSGSIRPSCDLSHLSLARRLDLVESKSASARNVSRPASDTVNPVAHSDDGLKGIQRQTPSQCILDTVAICFDGLWVPFQSRNTRRLMLQSYHNALQILRVALLSDPHDNALIMPTRSLAFYEVCSFAFCRP
jgi:hypothetical protein